MENRNKNSIDHLITSETVVVFKAFDQLHRGAVKTVLCMCGWVTFVLNTQGLWRRIYAKRKQTLTAIHEPLLYTILEFEASVIGNKHMILYIFKRNL